MVIEKQEKPVFSPEDLIHESNIEIIRDVTRKIEAYLKFIKNSIYIRNTRHIELGYAKKDWPQIEKLFSDIPGALSEMDKNKKIAFSQRDSLDHILGNYALMGQRGVEGRRMERNVSVGIPLTPEIHERMRDLNEDDIQIFAGFKEEWNLILYYLELVKNHPDILETEMTSEDGWFGEHRDFFQGQKIPVMDVKDQLKYINFFARLRNFPSELGDVRGLKNLVDPIGEENFENEFNQLPRKDDKTELLNKESVRRYFLEEPEHRQAA